MNVISEDPIEECRLADLLTTIDTVLVAPELLARYQIQNSVNDEDLQELVGDIMIKDIAQRVIIFKGRRCVISSVYEELLLDGSVEDEKDV
jgi:hypothetical protein